MLTEKQLEEFREALKSAKKPLFFYDDDPDGVCSYLILKKFSGKGSGIIKKSSPELGMEYIRKVQEYNPDKIFVLDTPLISQEFIDSIKQPIYWLDHHPLEKRDNVHYFNPLQNGSEGIPTSGLAYYITKKDLWLAMIGTTADWFYPDFVEEFKKQYPGIIETDTKKPDDLLFNSKISKIIKLLQFLLKSTTSEIRKSISILEKIDSPLELLEESSSKSKYLFRKIKKAQQEYDLMLKKALKQKIKDEVLLFKHPVSKWSFTRELATELNYASTAKVIIVARLNKGVYKMSIRSKIINLQKILPEALDHLRGYGGGHKFAVGATVKEDDFNEFISRLTDKIKQNL